MIAAIIPLISTPHLLFYLPPLFDGTRPPPNLIEKKVNAECGIDYSIVISAWLIFAKDVQYEH